MNLLDRLFSPFFVVLIWYVPTIIGGIFVLGAYDLFEDYDEKSQTVWIATVLIPFLCVLFFYLAKYCVCPVCGHDTTHSPQRAVIPRCKCSGCNRSNFRRVKFIKKMESNVPLTSKDRLDRINYWRHLLKDKKEKHPIWSKFTTTMWICLTVCFIFPVIAFYAFLLW